MDRGHTIRYTQRKSMVKSKCGKVFYFKGFFSGCMQLMLSLKSVCSFF
ncbi:hypothetical protein M5D96_013875 [Drosophila gunungcola]|uniref:Uncharacterized protein n=1 Tax=Drosophila gunungcola TaxID=103775 RepID=A0A9Q0BJ56_9MUSC|nr:hypothetical protein M5D96_013875 [Drosophila gunungcola]